MPLTFRICRFIELERLFLSFSLFCYDHIQCDLWLSFNLCCFLATFPDYGSANNSAGDNERGSGLCTKRYAMAYYLRI